MAIAHPDDAPPEPCPERYLGYLVSRLAHVLQLRFEAELGEVGLTVRQFGVLAHLRTMPGICSAELARRISVTPQSMTDLVGSLETAGLVERASDSSPGKPLGLRLTRRGRRTLERALPIADRMQCIASEGLGPDEVETLRGLLTRMLARLSPHP